MLIKDFEEALKKVKNSNAYDLNQVVVFRHKMKGKIMPEEICISVSQVRINEYLQLELTDKKVGPVI